jgi:hypothetical protein
LPAAIYITEARPDLKDDDMPDPGSIVITCSHCDDIIHAANQVKPSLTYEMRRRLNDAISYYVRTGGMENVFERLNGKAVSQVLAEYDSTADSKVIAEGERNGVRFTLFDAPRPEEPGQAKP